MTGDLNCPNCHQVDSVQKVTSIVSAGTSTEHYSGHIGGLFHPIDEHVSGSTTTKTELSKRLAGPAKPYYSSAWGCWSKGLVALLILLGLSSLIAGTAQSGLGTGLIIGLLYGGIEAIAIFVWKHYTTKSRRANCQVEYLYWQKTMAKWEQVYYCHRCDGVFVPGRAELAPVSEMSSFLYRIA